jgi:hypothetical protein
MTSPSPTSIAPKTAAPSGTAGGPRSAHASSTAPGARASSATSAASWELAVAVSIVTLLARFVDGGVLWLLGVTVLAGVALAALQILSEGDAASRVAGVPIESLVLPSTVAFAGVGVLHLVPLGLWLLPAVAVLAWVLLRSMAVEARLLRTATRASSADRTTVLTVALGIGLLAFTSVAAIVTGGLPDPAVPSTPPTASQILSLAGADGLIGFLLGYRLAALRSSNVRDVGWSASLAAAVVAIAAASLRVLEIPGFLGPALLVLVFFLWQVIHDDAPMRRRDSRRIWETALLVALGVVIVAWSLGLRS